MISVHKVNVVYLPILCKPLASLLGVGCEWNRGCWIFSKFLKLGALIKENGWWNFMKCAISPLLFGTKEWLHKNCAFAKLPHFSTFYSGKSLLIMKVLTLHGKCQKMLLEEGSIYSGPWENQKFTQMWQKTDFVLYFKNCTPPFHCPRRKFPFSMSCRHPVHITWRKLIMEAAKWSREDLWEEKCPSLILETHFQLMT